MSAQTTHTTPTAPGVVGVTAGEEDACRFRALNLPNPRTSGDEVWAAILASVDDFEQPQGSLWQTDYQENL